MIDANNLTKKFGELTAVKDLTLHVDEGEVFGFLGPNGAGKTTTVRMLCCLISSSGGSATVGGYDINNKIDSPKIRKMIGYVPDNVGLYEELSAYENLDFYGKLYGCTDAQRKENIERFLRMLGLWENRDNAAGKFSKGMKQKLALARALIHEPKVLFMDEPTANLDPEASKTVRDFILELKKEKRTIFLNTHNLEEAQKICDRIGILNTSLRAVGRPEDLEGSVRSRKTVIQLVSIDDNVLKAVKELALGNVAVEGNKLMIDVTDPERENPMILDSIFKAGGRVQLVNVVGSTLEETYLSLVRREA